MRVILIDPDDSSRPVLAVRLRAQGYTVDTFADAAEGANSALASPPAAVIADIWMKGISGVQLCRLLRAEIATSIVPVILRATHDSARNRFWSRRAGAAGYVAKGRMGELVRALNRCIREHPVDESAFFMQLPDGSVDVRDRISGHLDTALFESVLASEVRVLGALGSFDRLMDLFSQLLVQITAYRWVVIETVEPPRLGVHTHPINEVIALREASALLGLPDNVEVVSVIDEDADPESEPWPALYAPIEFGGVTYGRVAVGPSSASELDQPMVDLIGRELGGPLRMIALVEETRRLASIDHLTGLPRRGMFAAPVTNRINAGHAVAVAILDLDHFKAVNDNFGHAVGDEVLAQVGRLLGRHVRGTPRLAARWGGEEFVVELTLDRPDLDAEAIRAEVATIEIFANGRRVPVTASVGWAVSLPDERLETLISRADEGLYEAKRGGRNRIAAARVPEANAA